MLTYGRAPGPVPERARGATRLAISPLRSREPWVGKRSGVSAHRHRHDGHKRDHHPLVVSSLSRGGSTSSTVPGARPSIHSGENIANVCRPTPSPALEGARPDHQTSRPETSPQFNRDHHCGPSPCMSVTRPSRECRRWRLSKQGGGDEQRTRWHLFSGSTRLLPGLGSSVLENLFSLEHLFLALGSSSTGSLSLSSLHGASIIVLGAPGGARGVFGATGGASRATGSSSCVDVGSPPSTSAPRPAVARLAPGAAAGPRFLTPLAGSGGLSRVVDYSACRSRTLDPILLDPSGCSALWLCSRRTVSCHQR
ncbi:uncharacterized protein SCHCODRAFT_02096838 [Schizophyllum commune H4-8]|uniref:uncharacterized protein n=1 Tax=Schizophyllum commune (strain H4-8 / FGSC 9210) TaxID=578458 RepID=UPI0021610530|nr:uncharacterized protein SCHCODRAFT_02096838 [Schizophyllum commune H4-8]KAI5886381.1 hypothetical protein SCHCODRAFT_02096838 [Schizophyllum commune H4-8]